MPEIELDITEDGTKDAYVAFDEIMDAVAAASDQDRVTWLITTDGESKPRRIAAIVPVEMVVGLCLRHLQPCYQDSQRHLNGERCK